MSISALLRGVESRLRSAAVLDDAPREAVGKVCGVQADGSPPPFSGQFYYAVWFNGARNNDPNALSMEWYYNVGVTVTAKMGYAPKDRRGARLTTSNELLDRAMAVAAALHQDDSHRIEANQLIVGTAEWAALQTPTGRTTVNGFLEPLRFQSVSKVQDAPPGWAGTDGQNEMLFVDVLFRDAFRAQYIGG